MNTLFTSRLNGIFILNTLLELHKPVTVSELAGMFSCSVALPVCVIQMFVT